MLRKAIKRIATLEAIDNIKDAVVSTRNRNGTYNVRLPSGAIKQGVINLSSMDFYAGDVVTISMVGGRMETAKIVGKSARKKNEQKIIVLPEE